MVMYVVNLTCLGTPKELVVKKGQSLNTRSLLNSLGFSCFKEASIVWAVIATGVRQCLHKLKLVL